METVRHPARRRIGLVLAVLAGLYVIVNLGLASSAQPVIPVAGVAVPALLMVLFLASAWFEAAFSYWCQALGLVAAGLASAAWGGAGQPAALPLLVMGGLLLWRYRLLRPGRAVLGLALVLPAPLFIAGGLAGHHLGGSLVSLALFWAVFLVVFLTVALDLQRFGRQANRGSVLARLGETSALNAAAAVEHLELLRKRLAMLPAGTAEKGSAVDLALDLLEADIRALAVQAEASGRMLRERRELGPIIESVLQINAQSPVFHRQVRFEAALEPACLELVPEDFREAVNTLVRSAGEAVLATGKPGTVRVSCNAQALVVEDQGRPGSGEADLLVWVFCRAHGFGLRFASIPGGGSRATIDFAAAQKGKNHE